MSPRSASEARRRSLAGAAGLVALAGACVLAWALVGRSDRPGAPSASPGPAAVTAAPFGTVPAADASARSACEGLVEAVATLDWRAPTLVASSLERYAVPSVAESLAGAPHMTPGEIAQRFDVVPSVREVEGGDGAVDVATSASAPGAGTIETTWRCTTERAAGRFLVTGLTSSS